VTFTAAADTFVQYKISEISAQITLQLDELNSVEEAGLHWKGITAGPLMRKTAKCSPKQKISKGHLAVMCSGNT
jgi:hypothetical protein